CGTPPKDISALDSKARRTGSSMSASSSRGWGPFSSCIPRKKRRRRATRLRKGLRWWRLRKNLPSRDKSVETQANVMTPVDAMKRINLILADAWMVRTFLKHAEEMQQDEELQEVHRMIFDYVRALEPSFQHQDVKEYLHGARG